MDSISQVIIHESEFPEANFALLKQGLRQRDLSQKFLYQSPAQTARWLSLHKAYSPALLDPACVDAYDQAFLLAAQSISAPVVHAVSLGCGGGQKDLRLLQSLRAVGKSVVYTPVDTSLGMVLTASQKAASALRGLQSQPMLLDLPSCTTLPALLKPLDPAGSQRIIALFGVLHTFEAADLLPRILNSIRSQDILLVSANLADSHDYDSALERILPQYNNLLTREWLLGALVELGFDRDGCSIEVSVGSGPNGLKRFEAFCTLMRDRSLIIDGETFHFAAGSRLRLFYSYRYTPEIFASTLLQFGLHPTCQWVAPSGEEGIALCRRQSPAP